MSGFNNIAKLQVESTVTKELVLGDITTPEDSGPVTLIGVFAGKSNRPFTNAVIRKNAMRLKSRRGKQVNFDTMVEARKDDEEIFAKHIITDWKNVFHDNGKKAPFNSENLAKLLTALPDDLFDEVREFFTNPETFRDSELFTEADAEELGNG